MPSPNPRVRTLRNRGLAFVLLLGTATGLKGEGRSTLVPILGAGEAYDDNLFATPSAREGDWISRFTAGLEWDYRSTPFSLLTRYSRDAEVFSLHPALNTTRGREGVDLDMQYRPTPTLLVALVGAALDTHTPEELTTVTGLDIGRLQARRLSSGASITQKFGPLLKGTVGYSFVRDEVVGGLVGDTHDARLAFDRRLDPRDAVSLAYEVRFYIYGPTTIPAQAVSLGFTRELDARTHLKIAAGPRYSLGNFRPEVEVSLGRAIHGGQISLAVARRQGVVLGEAHPVDVQSANLVVAAEPLHALRLSIAPGASWDSVGPYRATIYRVLSDLSCRVTTWLVISASHQFNSQEGSLDRGPGDRIARNVVVLRIVATPQIR